MNAPKGGKKPVESKPKQSLESFNFTDDPFTNPLRLPEGLRKAFEKEGLEVRFINIKRLNEMHGFHNRGWKPYTKEFANIEVNEFHWGTSPDGKIIRGDLVLAVRPISLGDKHRAALKQKADRLNLNQKKNAAELRKLAAGRAKIHEGYDDNE